MQDHCNWKLGFSICENLNFSPTIFLYHPALGPLYSIISQKLTSGILYKKSELQLEIAEIFMDKISIEGSLIIKAKNIMGHWKDKKMNFSSKVGKCVFQNVQIKNKGIDYSANNVFWKNSISRAELCYVELEGNSLFIAQDIVIEGNQHIFVPDGKKMIARPVAGGVSYHIVPLLTEEEKLWDVQIDRDVSIILKKVL